MRISDWSSDVCSSDLQRTPAGRRARMVLAVVGRLHERPEPDAGAVAQVGQHKRPAVEKRLPESGLAAVADQRGEIALRLRAVVRDARGAQIGTVGNPKRARRARSSEEHKSELQALMR